MKCTTHVILRTVQRRLAGASLLLLALSITGAAAGFRTAGAQARSAASDSGVVHRVARSGPRLGLIVLSHQDIVDAKIGSQLSTLFGWQTETDFAAQSNGSTGISALYIGVAGVEQQTFLPTASWFIGFRDASGAEFGVGPNVSAGGAALAATAGLNRQSGSLNIPFNLAVVFAQHGPRISLTFGFNSADDNRR